MRRLTLCIALCFLLLGCSRGMFSGTHAKEGVDALRAKIGADTKVKRVTVFDNDVLVNAEDPQHPGQLVQWWYADGKVGGPKPIMMPGGGSLAKVLFHTSDLDFTKVPGLVDAVKKKSGKEVRQLDVSYDVDHPDVPLAWLVETMDDKFWVIALDGTNLRSTEDDDRYGNRVLQLRLREGSE